MVKKKRSVCDHRQLLLTNRVEFKSHRFQSALALTQSGERAPGILVARLVQGTQTRYFVLDGNHRSVAHAYLNRPVPYYLIQSKDDIDWILQAELEGGIDHFPHRSFLSGCKDFITLLGEAMVASSREADGCSAFDVAFRFVRETYDSPATKPEEVKINQVAANIERCRFVLLKNGEPWLPMERDSMTSYDTGERSSATPLDESLSGPNVRHLRSHPSSVDDSYPFGRTQSKFVSKGDVENWSDAVRRYFSSIKVHEEFPCAYSRFEVICGEGAGRGPTITRYLIEIGLLERVRVGEIETGAFYSSGKPVRQRITYWRFLR